MNILRAAFIVSVLGVLAGITACRFGELNTLLPDNVKGLALIGLVPVSVLVLLALEISDR